MPLAALDEGEMVSVQVQGQPVLVCQVDGQFYALADRCSHASQALSRGRLKGFELRCPLHGARFDVRSGAALSAPATHGIATYPVLIEGGKVCVVAPER